ncbi:unnamed protein product [Closterium sp. Yama58-4]|nr:unnamed protein product [Closterium sp. Yama58-4]
MNSAASFVFAHSLPPLLPSLTRALPRAARPRSPMLAGVACSTMDLRADDRGGRAPFKPKLEVVLGKSEHFDQLMAAAAEEALVAPPETT